MYDFEIAFHLYKMSKIHSLFFKSQYKARAYYNAAMALDAHNVYVRQMYGANKLQDIPHVGVKIEKCIVEIIETGVLHELEEYEKEFHISDYTLLLSNGLSDTLIQKLWQESIHSADDLQDALKQGKINDIFKMSELKKINCFIEEYARIGGKYLRGYGECLGNELLEFLRGIKGIGEAEFCGEMSCFCEKIQSIEIIFTYQGCWEYLIKKMRQFQRVTDVCSEKLVKISGSTAFGIPFCLYYKEEMEVQDEIQCLEFAGCINIKDIRGDLHSHTNWTDGIHSISQMCQEAKKLGYEYFAITDHSVSMRVAHGLSESQAFSQIQKIRECEKEGNIKILAGIEVDILQDGTLDYSDDVLCQFDFVVAAVHSFLEQSPMEIEHRLEKALSNPYVNVLAHPTGRLLGRPGVLFSERKGYQESARKIIELCKEHQVVLEINCFPERMDLCKENALMAVEQGVKLSLGTDSHSAAHLRNMEYGVSMLAAAGINKEMVLNTYSYEKLLSFLRYQRSKGEVRKEKVFFANKKDFQYYFRNAPDILNGEKRIIGIDLTGSEDKESGWSYMTGEYAECRRIKTDKELIETIVNLKPDVVSIDSPLAYPKGRHCASKGCECAKYGIMRESERMLRHFGIMVYPCLIDSMVNVTTRGMKLAKTLRNLGYTVIESYPGVAQDILMIPRKGKSREQFLHLMQGLVSFGIKGDLLEKPEISHDEVDAITCALVGYFYLNGQYIGLGNKEEDYLIVPRVQEELLQKRLVIGLCGETGAGKTTVAAYLQFKYGLKYFRYSQVIEQKYQTKDKKELQRIGAKIASDEQKQRELTRFMVERMGDNSSYVIDGLRHYEDYDELKKYFGKNFIFIYIDCRYKNRCQRYQKLYFNKVSDADFREINDHESESQISFLQMYANYRTDNNKGYKDMWKQIDQIIKEESGGKV